MTRLASVLLLTLSGWLMHAAAQTVQTPDPFKKDRQWLQKANEARTYGTDTSKVVIHEFADFACPDCKWFFENRLDSLKTRYLATGKANFVYHTYVIARLMRGYHGAEAALCAGALGGKPAFEGMMAQLFRNQDTWRRLANPMPTFEAWAKALKVPLLSFRDCTARDVMAPLIVSDMRLGVKADIPGTPALVLTWHDTFNGDHKTEPDLPFTKLDALIERLNAQRGR